MFGKLIRYEWKAMAHTLIPMYLLVLLISGINGVMMRIRNHDLATVLDRLDMPVFTDFLQSMIFLLYFAVIIGLFILTFVITVQRFYKGILGDEGYLILTVPVKPWQIPAAKCIVAMIFGILSAVVALISIIFMADQGWIIRNIMITDWAAMFYDLGRMIPLWPLYAAEFLLASLLGTAAELYHIYLAIMLGQCSNSHKLVFSFLWYVVINIILSLVSWILMIGTGFTGNWMQLLLSVHPERGIHALLLISLVSVILQLAVFAAGTNYLMGRKLNV